MNYSSHRLFHYIKTDILSKERLDLQSCVSKVFEKTVYKQTLLLSYVPWFKKLLGSHSSLFRMFGK